MSDRWFCFLRAINTGDRRVTNQQLIDALGAVGLDDVAAYQAAGNLTFRSGGGEDPDDEELTETLSIALGFDCPVFLRSAEELREIVAVPPFGEAVLASTERRVQLTLLRDVPDAATISQVEELVPDEDRVVVGDREWWWLPQRGISTSALPVRQIERLLGLMTMRTAATIDRMMTKFLT